MNIPLQSSGGVEPASGNRLARFSGLLRLIVLAVITTLLVIGGYAIWRHYHPIQKSTPVSSDRLATAADQENRYSKVIDQNLQKGDVSTYQIAQLELANAYIVDKDYTSASRLLNEVLNNVPADKLVPYTYQLLIQVAQYNKDTAKEKTYLQKIIPLLKAQQRDEEAASYQKQLDGLGQSS